MTTCPICGSELEITSYEWIDGFRYCWDECLPTAVTLTDPGVGAPLADRLHYVAGIAKINHAATGDDKGYRRWLHFELASSKAARDGR